MGAQATVDALSQQHQQQAFALQQQHQAAIQQVQKDKDALSAREQARTKWRLAGLSARHAEQKHVMHEQLQAAAARQQADAPLTAVDLANTISGHDEAMRQQLSAKDAHIRNLGQAVELAQRTVSQLQHDLARSTQHAQQQQAKLSNQVTLSHACLPTTPHHGCRLADPALIANACLHMCSACGVSNLFYTVCFTAESMGQRRDGFFSQSSVLISVCLLVRNVSRQVRNGHSTQDIACRLVLCGRNQWLCNRSWSKCQRRLICVSLPPTM